MPAPPEARPTARRSEHGTGLLAQLEAVEEGAEVPEEIDTEFILKLSGMTRLKPPYTRWRLVLLGEDQHWGYYVLASREARERLRQLLEDFVNTGEDDSTWPHAKTWETFVRDLIGIELYGPADRADPSLDDLSFEQPELLDVRIWPSERVEEANRRVEIVRQVVARAANRNDRCRVVVVDPRPATSMVRVYSNQELLANLLGTAVVEKVKRPPTPRLHLADLYDFTPPEIGEPTGVPIGVIDDGVVTANRLLAPVVQTSQSFPTGYVFAPPGDHGSAVCGLAAFGDFEAAMLRQQPLSNPHPIHHARVLEPDGLGRTRFAPTALHYRTFEEAVRWLVQAHQVRVVIAAITDDYEFLGPLVDEWTQTVDELVRELDIVIVVPTGNIPRPFGETFACGCHVLNDYPCYLARPQSRLASPAIAALAVTVGSIAPDGFPGGAVSQPAAAAAQLAVAQPGQPSPFTRIGPGPGRSRRGSTKPDFVATGGNWVYDGTLHTAVDRDPSTSVITTVRPQGSRELGAVTGTSFAAPRVAHAFGEIATRYPDASANLLRALAAAAARPPKALETIGEIASIPQLHLGGFGLIDVDKATDSGGSRVVLIYEGEIDADTVMIHRIPVPPELLRGYSRRTIRIALAYDPPVRRQRREYIAGSMSFDLVRGHSLGDVETRYQRQPSRNEADAQGLERLGLPEGRPTLSPGDAWFYNNTLICRSFSDTLSWDEDVLDYFVVVEHQRSPWTQAQRRRYTEQPYALVVELHDEGRADLDLYSLVRAQLAIRARIRR